MLFHVSGRSAMNTITAYTVVNVVIGLLLLIGFAVLVVVTIWYVHVSLHGVVTDQYIFHKFK